jgi:hypothetical protein
MTNQIHLKITQCRFVEKQTQIWERITLYVDIVAHDH